MTTCEPPHAAIQTCWTGVTLCCQIVPPWRGRVFDEYLPGAGEALEDAAHAADRPQRVGGQESAEKLAADAPHVEPHSRVEAAARQLTGISAKAQRGWDEWYVLLVI